mgnify:FL=1
MSDWGKVISVFMQGKAAMILAIFVAILAFAPIDALEPHRVWKAVVGGEPNEDVRQSIDAYQVWLSIAGALAVASIVGNILYWLKGGEIMQWLRCWLDQLNRGKAFKQLSEAQQLLVLDLYFGGHASALIFDDEQDEIRELLNEDFVETSWVDSSFGCPLQLTPSARGFIRGDKEQKKVLRKELIDKGIREKIYKLSV